MTKRLWFLVYGIFGIILIVQQSSLYALGRPGGMLLIPTVPLTAAMWLGWRMTRTPKATPAPTRTPAFPGGRGCPAGCCPICGMEDPDGTAYAWSVGLSVRRAHIACVEWLGEIPAFDPVALDPDGDVRRQLEAEDPDGPWARRRDREERRERERRKALSEMAGIRPSEMREILREMGNPAATPSVAEVDHFIRRKSREQRRQAACLHRNVRAHGDGRTGVCMDCHAIGELVRAEVPLPAGEITLPAAWTPEQVEAFRVAWAAAAPGDEPAKSKIIRIQHG